MAQTHTSTYTHTHGFNEFLNMGYWYYSWNVEIGKVCSSIKWGEKDVMV